jgi:hypothetical protein
MEERPFVPRLHPSATVTRHDPSALRT